MASLTVRNIDDDLKQRLRVRAAKHGRSMEAEVREILKRAVSSDRSGSEFARRIHERFAAVGGVELELPTREIERDPPNFR